MDFRKEWFKNRILNYFDEYDPNLFEIFLKTGNDSILQQLNAFLNEESNAVVDIQRQVFIVYKTYYSKIVQEEIEVKEEVTKQRSSSFLQDDKRRDKKVKKKKKGKKLKDKVEDEDDEAEDKPDDDSLLDVARSDDMDDDDNKQKKKKIKKIGKSGGRISPYTMMENVPQEEHPIKSKGAVCYITVKKQVEKVIQVPQFQGHFGIINIDEFEQSNYYVYFIKKQNRIIPKFLSLDEADSNMPNYFVIGSLTGNVLQNLEKLLNSVFLSIFRVRFPSIEQNNNVSMEYVEFDGIRLQKRPSYYFIQKHTKSFNIMKDELPIRPDKSLFYDHLKNFIQPEPEQEWKELHDRLQSLIEIVKWAQTELTTEKKVHIPEIFCNFDWENSDISLEMINESKILTETWINQIDSEIKNAQSYEISNENLFNEHKHWKRMEIYLSSVVDELNSALINKIMGIVKIQHSFLSTVFDAKRTDLYRTYVSVKENADALQTLQYFFKILMHSDFKTISNAIPILIDSLQTVWVLSEYYSQEKNMLRVLIDIKNTLCSKTKTAFDVTKLFKNSWDDIKDDLKNSVLMLQAWKNSYLEVRARIESTREYFICRWEFDKRKLFSETDYISTVIEDIKLIFEIIQSYRCLFASKFRKMTEHTNEFKNLEKKILNLTVSIEKVDFDIYLEIFRDEWQEVLEIFQQDVIEVDQRLKILIIKTFSLIKSIKEGIEVVRNISEIKTRPTVHESLPYICNKIIAHFLKEIQVTEKFFEKNKMTHATVKIYESIVWAKSLTTNLQKTVISLQNVDCLSTLSNFQEVFELLSNFETKAENYIKTLFKEWCVVTITLIKDTLKQTVIEIEEAEKFIDLKKLNVNLKSVKISDDINASKKLPSLNVTDQSKDFNFGTLSMTLKWIAKSKMLAESALQKQKLETLKKIEQAHKVSWLEFISNSLLIEKGLRFKLKFQNDIFDVLTESENLQSDGFRLPSEVCELLAIKNYLLKSTQNIRNLINKYNEIIDELHPAKIILLKQYLLEMEMAIQPGLTLYTWNCTVLENYAKNISTQMEELNCLIYQVNKIFAKLDLFVNSIENLNFLPVEKVTNKNINCKEFFHQLDNLQKQEAKKCLNIYNTISLTLIQVESLTLLTNTGKSELMTYYYTEYSDKISSSLIRCETLEEVFTGPMLSISENNEIKLSPCCAELYHCMKTALIRAFFRLKALKQWEQGSCTSGKNSEELFYNRIVVDNDVKEKCKELLDNVQILCHTLKTTTKILLKYSILWKHDKQLTIKQFANENPQLGDYETRFDFYSEISSKIDREHLIVNSLCVNIETEVLISQLKTHCNEWKSCLGNQLAADTRQTINQISQKILEFSSLLNQEIKNEQVLIEVLKTIGDIQEAAFDMELKFYKIEEHHHELIMQNFKVDESDIECFNQLKIKWEQLYDTSLYRKYSIEQIKQLMTEHMKQKIRNFIITCQDFVADFLKEKTNFRTNEFDTLVEKIMAYSLKCNELYDKKKELEVVQNCFEIAPFEFTFFVEIKNELESMREEYKLLE